MQGDAVIMNCFYRPEKDFDVHGGWSSHPEAMCTLTLGVAGDNSTVDLGFALTPDQPFLQSYTGPFDIPAEALDYANATFPPNEEGRNFVALKDHFVNLCDLAV